MFIAVCAYKQAIATVNKHFTFIFLCQTGWNLSSRAIPPAQQKITISESLNSFMIERFTLPGEMIKGFVLREQ